MKLTIIGSGKMGEALARGILRAGLVAPGDLTLTDVDLPRLQTLSSELGAQSTADNTTAVAGADVVILAVKPFTVAEVCATISPKLRAGTVVLSIAAGIPLADIAGAISRDDVALARAMPNTPCLVGAGAIAVSFHAGATAIPDAVRRSIRDLLAPLGLVEEMPENRLDAITGLSGSGPAYIAILIEALADGGVQMGLPRATAQQFAAQTVLGTAKLILETGQHPGQVKDGVSSPGGTTIAGIAALEEHGFRAAAMAAVRAATQRSRELAQG